MEKTTQQHEPNTDATAPAPTIEPIGTVAESIAARIATERDRLAAEEKRELELTEDRKRLLTAGTDKEVDECERNIDASRSAQLRSQERIELLTAQLEQANAAAQKAELDAIEARDEAARLEGERLIRGEYVQLATKLAAVLKRLLVIDRAIERDNYTLERAGRAQVSNSNHCRVTPMRNLTFTKKVRVTPIDPRHSLHEQWKAGRVTQNFDNHGSWSRLGGHPLSRGEVEEEVDEERSDMIGADYPPPLYDVVVLPAVDPMPYIHESLPQLPIPQPFFENSEVRHTDVTDAEIEALHVELEQARKGAKRKTNT